LFALCGALCVTHCADDVICNSITAHTIQVHIKPPPLSPAEAATEKERLERVARERLAEMSKHSSFVAVDKKPSIKRSKTSTDMQAVVKSSRLESLPVVKALNRGPGAHNASHGSLPVIKGAASRAEAATTTPIKGTRGHTIAHGGSTAPVGAAAGAARGAVVKGGAQKGRPDSRGDRSGASSPISPLEMGELVRTFSDDGAMPMKGGFGPSLMVGGSGAASTAGYSTVSDYDQELSDAEDEYHSSKVYGVSKVFSGTPQPVHIAGDLGDAVPRRAFTIDMENVRSRLDDPMPDDLAMETSYAPASPRAIFLAGCLNAAIPPITVALIRKKISSTINLAHMGLGTKIAKVLAPCLSAVPHLQLLNLSDNNLDDEGLSLLIRAISKHRHIEILDISQNIIGSEAAEALAEFLGHPECRLQCLRMSTANIDDGECANFVEVLMSNHHLKVR
jgi:hypothetical protein